MFDWFQKMPIRVQKVIRIVFAILGSAAGAQLTLEQLGIWTVWPAIAVIEVLFLAGIAVLSQGRAVHWLNQRDPYKERHPDFQFALKPLLDSVAEVTGYDVNHIGVSVFRVVTEKVTISGAKPKRMEILQRAYRYRWNNEPQESQILWTKGKGTIGTCWETRRREHRDLRPDYAAFVAAGGNRDAFNALPAETVRKMTFEEFQEIMPKYGEVLAIPVLLDGKAAFIGCISVDIPAQSCVPGSTKIDMENDALREATSTAAVAVRLILK